MSEPGIVVQSAEGEAQSSLRAMLRRPAFVIGCLLLAAIVFIAIAVLLLFIVLANWAVIAQPTELNLLVTTLNAPLGLLFLIVALAVFTIDFAVHSFSRLSWSRERRDLTAQIERQRVLADQAEESRIRELREAMERELAGIRVQLERLSSR